jgi:hypothetical protein
MRFILSLLLSSISLSSAADSAVSQRKSAPPPICVSVAGNAAASPGAPKRSADSQACTLGAKANLIEYGDRGYGSCGGYCNDIRPESRYQCKKTQRPMYNEEGRCLCGYFDECK